MAFPTGWGRRCKLTIQSSQVDSNLSNFRVYLNEDTLPSEMFDADGSYYALNGGGDIRFSSDEAGSTRLACDVNDFTTDNDPANGTASIWVLVASVASGADTDIYVWYHKAGETQPAADEAYGSEAANPYADCEFRSHMDDNPDSSHINDETENDRDGTKTNTPNEVAGVCNVCQNFDQTGAQEYITISSLMGSQAALTILCWVNLEVVESGGEIISLGDHVILRFNGSGDIDFIYQYGAITWHLIHDEKDYRGDGWHHLAYRCNPGGSVQQMLVDGTEEASDTQSDAIYYTGGGSNTMIARHGNGATNRDLDGQIDEITIYNEDKGEDWCVAEYRNQNSPGTFVVEGTPETPGGAGNPWYVYRNQ